MSTLESAPVRATDSHVFNSKNVRAAALGALRELFAFPPALSDESVLVLIRIRRAVNDVRDGLVDNLMGIIDMCDGPAPVGSYPDDYEANALAHYEGRRQ